MVPGHRCGKMGRRCTRVKCGLQTVTSNIAPHVRLRLQTSTGHGSAIAEPGTTTWEREQASARRRFFHT